MTDELAGILFVVGFIAFAVCVLSHPAVLLIFFLVFLFVNALKK